MKKTVFLFSFLVFLAFVAFWYFGYWGNLAMLERTAFFQFDADFLERKLRNPAGLSDYLGAFVSQLFYYRWLGALLMALFLTAFFVAVERLMTRLAYSPVYTPFALVATALPFLMVFTNIARVGNLLAFLFVAVGAWLYAEIESGRKRRILFTALYPLFFGLTGAFPALTLYLFCILFDLTAGREKERSRFFFYGGWLLLGVCYPLLWQKWVTCISDGNLFFIAPDNYDASLRRLYGVIYFLPLLLWLFSRIPLLRKTPGPKGRAFLYGFSVAAAVFGSWLLIRPYAVMSRYMEVQYRADEAVIAGDWDGVLATAGAEKVPSRQMLHFVALALSQKGELADRIFNYPIVSDIFVAPPKDNGYLDACMSSEFYYRMGISNEAFHGAFQASVSNLDFRSLKRMALLAVDRGEDALAEKYLSLLDKTLFYPKFVREQRKRLNSVDRKVEPVRPGHYFIRSSRFISEMAYLIDLDFDNNMAKDYLLCTLLLQKNLDKFCEAFPYLYPPGKLRRIPKAYEEALLLGMRRGKQALIDRNYPISEQSRKAFESFYGIYEKGNKEDGYLKRALSGYRHTWWYYDAFIQPRQDSKLEKESSNSATS